MINTVPHIVEHQHAGFYELVATTSLDLFSEKFQDFKLVVDYDPSKPDEEDIRIHGIREAKKRARINTFNNAAEATCNGWGYGLAECYRKVIGKAGLGKQLERAILNWDVQVSCSYFYLPTYLLITPSVPFLESLSFSRKISCFLSELL